MKRAALKKSALGCEWRWNNAFDERAAYVNLVSADVIAFPTFPVQEPVAQLVEHRTFNAVVAGSSPARLTIIFNKLDGVARLLLV